MTQEQREMATRDLKRINRLRPQEYAGPSEIRFHTGRHEKNCDSQDCFGCLRRASGSEVR